MPPPPTDDPSTDPRRWLSLIVLLATVVLIALDTSVLNVAIPTMLRELDTTVPSLEWVIAGYSLTFASLLIIGGRLGDLYGHRRLFIIGAALFGIGSLIASLAQSVGALIVGEAVLEGIGAALMLPSTLAIMSALFLGKERATAFAAWGAAAGAAVAFGPVLGGFLTTNYSWRWSFRINVIVAPLAIIGALLFMRRVPRAVDRPGLDLPGAAMIAGGMFLIVFALSQGPHYGWWAPIEPLTIAGTELWPTGAPVSVIPVALLAGLGVVAAFVAYERAVERRGGSPLFEISQLRHRTFRYGLTTTVIMALGQLGVIFVMPLFLQGARQLSAQENGLWMLPMGLSIIVAAQVAGRLTRRVGVTNVVRAGLVIETVGILVLILVVSPDVTFWTVLPGLAVFGVGVGFASAQLSNVVLSEISQEHMGVASGANSTSRQLGFALGSAVLGSLLTVVTTNRAVESLRSSGLGSSVVDDAIRGVESMGAGYQAPTGSPEALLRAFDDALTSGARFALAFAGILVLCGAALSFLIPRLPQDVVDHPPPEEELEALAADIR